MIAREILQHQLDYASSAKKVVHVTVSNLPPLMMFAINIAI